MGKKRRRSEVSGSDIEECEPRKKKFKDKWTVLEAVDKQTGLCNQLYEFLRKYKDSNKHCLSEFLIRAPSRRLQPNYYDVISHPIDMMRIQQKLKTDDYKTVSDFLADVRLLLDNALTYYDKSTEEHQNAVELERVFTWKLHDAGLGVDSDSDSLQSPTSLTLKIPKSQLLTPTGETSQATSKTVKPVSKTSSSSSTRPPLRLKLTRSKAWLEEYLNSDEPIKIYLASVYNYHDPSGEYVAEVFHDLPDRTDYPEYYRVITEPIDLNTIRRNVETGRYLNLKTIQDDLLLMIKNAHYFNEPGSGVYKSASSLKKIIISKCSELERRYQTVVKTVQFPDDSQSVGSSKEGKRVPVLKLRTSGDHYTSRRLSKSSSEVEDESQTESSDEDEDEGMSSDAGEEEEGGGGKLMLKIKKDRLVSDVDPVSKLLHMKKLPSLKRRLLAVYRSLTSKTDSSGRVLCELFMRRPSSKLYPEYYIVIKQPIDLREILQKIRGEEYSSLEEMIRDVDLMTENACTFNEEESVVYKDALVLKEVAHNALKKLSTAWTDVIPAPRGRPRKLSETTGTQVATPTSTGTDILNQLVTKHPTLSDCVALFKTVKASTGPNGRLLWLTFKQVPSQSASDYHSAVRKPLDFKTIESKLTSSQYSNVDQLMDDIALLCDNAYGYYHRGSGESKDALLLLRAAVKKYSELRAAERVVKPMVDVKKCVQKLLVEITTRIFDHKDSSGCHLVDSLKALTFTKDFYQVESVEETVVKHPFNLFRIKQFTMQGRYSRLTQLQDDLLTIFKLGREKYGSKMYRDTVELERLYLRVRDDVCKGGSVLWSPALNYTLTQLEEELSTQAKAHLKSPSPPPSVLSTSSSSSTSLTSPGSSHRGLSEDPEEKDVTMLEDTTSQEFFQELEYDDVMYHVGDVVYVTPMTESGELDEAKKPHVVLIEKLWTDGSGSKWLNGCWFYRPEETFHVATKKFYVREVFKSDFHGLAVLSRVKGKCCVLPVRDYVKHEPEGYQEEDVFVCESRYSFKAKSFRRIKSWNVLGQQQPTLKPRETPASLIKVPSVFAPSSTPLGKSAEPEEMDVDEKLEEISEDFELMLCENVVTSVSNPEQGHTYYEQYCIDNDYFRLGDFVYLRSDQELPFIARIERMWTDSNGDPWIRGPWFIRPSEVVHSPTRLFYEKELFMSNIQDTNPMRSISGKCSVMFISDYTKKHPTEFSEGDVYLVECRYNEAEKEIRKTKAIKQFSLSKSSIGDEMYNFPEELQLVRVASPKLHSKEFDPPTEAASKEKPVASNLATPTVTPTNLPAQLANILKAASSSSGGGGQSKTAINLNPQMLQQLLSTAAQLSTTRPVVIPLQQSALTSLAGSSSTKSPSTPSTPKSVTTPTVTTPTSSSLYTCQWDGCGKVFQNAADLSNHLLLIPTPGNMGMGHIIKTMSGYYCRWKNCPRNPNFDGKPFDVLPKITRHLKEVHLMKLSNTALGFNVRSSPMVSSTPSTPVLPPTTIPSATPPVRSVTGQTHQPTISTQVVQPPKECVIEIEDTVTQVDKSQLPRIFLPPPENRQKIVHSEIYKKYIRQVQSNSSYMSTLQDAAEMRASSKRPVPPVPLSPDDWLAPGALEKTADSASVVDALWALRDHMLEDSCRLARFMDRYH